MNGTHDAYARLTTAAHAGAFGANDTQAPSRAQLEAGNYPKGRDVVQGLRIVIEQPQGSIRTGTDATGKAWSSRMGAHYGYFNGTKGADGDEVDVFVGPYPESDQVFVINQADLAGGFDEHKVMLGFSDERHARGAYLNSFDPGWRGLKSIVQLTVSQLKHWLKTGNTRMPVSAASLPREESQSMTPKIIWDGAQPFNSTLDHVLYAIRQSDGPDGLLLDSVTVAEILEDSDGVLALDALVVQNAQVDRLAERLRLIMDRTGGDVKALSVQVTPPFKARGVTNIAVVFELSDGQTVSIFLHNPDTSPNKLSPTDEMISWKWLLNKKDITIVVAPERGEDLNPRMVAQRIMRLAQKNSAAFQKANAKRAERLGNIQALRDRIEEKEGILKKLMGDIEVAQLEKDQREAKGSDNDGYRAWSDAVEAALIAKGMTAAASQGVMDENSAVVEGAWTAREDAQAVADRIAPAEMQKQKTTELVDAAYQFANATDAFKAAVAESVEKSDYSPFASAKAMDMKAKELGAEIHWGMGAALDTVGEDEDDFNPEAEFEACPVEEGELDGDFKGHPFRGNQHKKASQHSHAAVRATISTKNAERDGDKKGAKSAHKSAHYSHMAAAESTTGKARKYHRKMAKFHGGRAGLALDAIEGWDDIEGSGYALDDAGDFDWVVGKIMKGGQLVGRAAIGGDGKAMVFVGESNDQRVQFWSKFSNRMENAMWSEDDGPRMVELLLAPQAEEPAHEVDDVELATPDTADEYLVKYLGQTKELVSQLKAAGKNYPSTEQFMKEVNSGNRAGQSVAYLTNDLVELMKDLQGVEAGSVTPRKIMGVGGTKKGAIDYLNDRIKKSNLALGHGGFMLAVNVSNYNYLLKKILKNEEDDSFRSDEQIAAKKAADKERAAKQAEEDRILAEKAASSRAYEVGSFDGMKKPFELTFNIANGNNTLLVALAEAATVEEKYQVLLKAGMEPKGLEQFNRKVDLNSARKNGAEFKHIEVAPRKGYVAATLTIDLAEVKAGQALIKLREKAARFGIYVADDATEANNMVIRADLAKGDLRGALTYLPTKEWLIKGGPAEDWQIKEFFVEDALEQFAGLAEAGKVSMFKDASPEALGLLKIGAQNNAPRSTYKTAVSVQASADTHGMAIRWEAVDSLPTFDDVMGGLFGDGDQGHICGHLTLNGAALARVFVREDGMAAFDYDKFLPEALGSDFDQFENDYSGWTEDWADIMFKLKKACSEGNGYGQRNPKDVFVEELKKRGWDDEGTGVFVHKTIGDVAVELETDSGGDHTATLRAWRGGSWVQMPDDATVSARDVFNLYASFNEDDVLSMVSDLADSADQLQEWLSQNPEQPAPAPDPVETDASRLSAAMKLAPKEREAITSDDPQAIQKLELKLTALMMRQEFMKKANRLLKKGDDAGLQAMGLSAMQIESMKKPDFMGRTGFADYELTNNNGVISATRKRLEQLQQLQRKQAEPTMEPTPMPPNPVGDHKAEDREFFMSVIDGSAPDILEPELAAKIEAVYTRNSADAEMVSLFGQAVNAYTQAMLNATAGV